MICPSKLCKCEIPDDSLYCDQCGIKILKCEKCGAIGISKFCGKCGGHMIFTGDANVNNYLDNLNQQKDTVQNLSFDPTGKIDNQFQVPEMQQPAISGTQIINLNSNKTKSLQLYHSDGWNIEPKSGDILGRVTGPFVDKLGSFPVISSRHAQITYSDDNWFITDLNSTNKTYLNEKQLMPNVPVQLSDKDVLVLANISFVVRVI